MKNLIFAGLALLFATIACAQEPPLVVKPSPAMEALKTEIEALKPAKVAWREIAWKSCLLDSLRESRAKGKPILLWVFIDRPADDARC